jgi:hypothetical protein
MPLKLPEPSFGTAEQAAPNGPCAIAALADGLGAAALPPDEDAVSVFFELHPVSESATATTATEADRIFRFMGKTSLVEPRQAWRD